MKSILQPICFAVQFLTRIPVPLSAAPDEKIAGRALPLFPAVGWLLGALLFCLWWLVDAHGTLSPYPAAIILIAAETLLTGAFHLDGLADSFDGFLSPGTGSDEKLAIMKDSRIGVMGATALVLVLLLKVSLLAECIRLSLAPAILVYPAAGRWAQVLLYSCSTYVRRGGIGQLFARAANYTALALATLLLIPGLFILRAPLGFVLVPLCILGFRSYAVKKVGGITGDVLGAATVLAEIAFLLGVCLSR
ncbi:adenosylcobinamide-GDP ribazoletransferase [Thermodesulfobacteriota bacterium]